jgi:hypothetical protein
MLIGVRIPTLIDWCVDPDLCLKDVDLDSNLELYVYTHNTHAHTRKPCSGAYIRIVESSVV